MGRQDQADKLDSLKGLHLAELAGYNGLVATYRSAVEDTQIPVATLVVAKEALDEPEQAWGTFQERFQILANRTASRICQPVHCGEDEAFYHASYRWLHGRHLGLRVRDQGLPPLPVALEWVAQIAEALDVLHAKAIPHHLLNPASVFLNNMEQAALLHGAWGGLMLRVPEGLRNPVFASCTLPFAAPEIASGAQGGDESADIYSLGALLYYLILGHPPFWEDDPAKLSARIAAEAPDLSKVEEVSGAVSELLEELLQKDPEERPMNLPALVSRLVSLAEDAERLDDAPTPKARPSPAPEPAKNISQIRNAVEHATRAIHDKPPEPAPAEKPRQEPERPSPAGSPPETTRRSTATVIEEEIVDPSENKKRLLLIVLGGLIAIVAAAGLGFGAIRFLMTPAPEPTGGRVTARQGPSPLETYRDYEQTARQLRQLGQYVRGYERQTGTWAQQLEDLDAVGVNSDLFEDAWGTRVDLRANYVISAGADGVFDNDDDLWFDAEQMTPGGMRPAYPGEEE